MCKLKIQAALSCCLLFAAAVPVQAQSSRLTGGYAGRAPATVTGDELGRQTNLWVLEVDFKPMRMIPVEVTDPRTGKKAREWVWYLAYRAINRPVERRADETDTEPQNDYDVQPQRPLFVPEFTLITSVTEGGPTEILRDTVIPEAEPLIRARERRELKNTVSVVREIPEVTPVGTAAEDVIYGVAIWRGVDPDTDFFTVFMSGFSNGYRIAQGPDDKPLVERRIVMQEFWRPGDRFDQQETEIRLKGDPRWLYVADEPKQLAAAQPQPPTESEPPTDADDEGPELP